MTPDETIILALTRENARLKLAHDLTMQELDNIAEALTALDVPTLPQDPFDPEGFNPAHRMRVLRQRIESFPLDLTERFHQLPGRLFVVTIPTSIESIEEYVVATDKPMVERWLKATHPQGFAKGYEPTIKGIYNMLGGTHWVSVPDGACCEAEKRNLNGGCDNCGAPCL